MNNEEQAVVNKRLAKEAGLDGPTCEYCILKDKECFRNTWGIKPATYCETFTPAEKSDDRTKPSNPKYAFGVKKVPMHVVPCGPLLEVALAFMEGGRKYGTHNYREVGVRASTYYNAALRHLMAWWEGEDIDSGSGVHHVSKAIACLFVVRDSMLMDNMTDDRPIRYTDGLPMDEINKIVEGIIEKYPDCKAPYTEKKDCND